MTSLNEPSRLVTWHSQRWAGLEVTLASWVKLINREQIRDGAGDIMFKLSQMKFESPNTQGEQEILAKFDALYNEMQETFRRLQEWVSFDITWIDGMYWFDSPHFQTLLDCSYAVFHFDDF